MSKVKFFPFTDVVTDITKRFNKIKASDYLEKGNYPIIDQGQNFIAGYTDNKELITDEKNPVIVFGDHTKVFKYLDFPFAIGADGVKVLEVNNKIANPEYIYQYLRRVKLHDGGYSRHFKYLKEIKIPVIENIQDQVKIATVLSKTEEIIKQREECIALADEYLKFTFLKMFGDPIKNEKGWDIKDLRSLIEEFKYGTSEKSSIDGLPVLRIPNVIGNNIDLSDLKFVKVKDSDRNNLLLKYGDILFVRSNGNPDFIGRSAVFNLKGEYVYASYLIRARLNMKKVNPVFVVNMLRTNSGKKMVRSYAKTSAGQYNINTEGLGNLKIITPEIELQNKFAEIVEQIEKIKEQYNESLKELKDLFNSLSQKAFKGELDLSNVDINSSNSIPSIPFFKGKEKNKNDEKYINDLPDKANSLNFNDSSQLQITFDSYDTDELIFLGEMIPFKYPFIREELLKLKINNPVTFDQLWNKVNEIDFSTTPDYQTLKEVLFDLMKEKPELFKQKFNEQTRQTELIINETVKA